MDDSGSKMSLSPIFSPTAMVLVPLSYNITVSFDFQLALLT
jgi:hypothetical protein